MISLFASLALIAQEAGGFEQRFVEFLLAEIEDETPADIVSLVAGADMCEELLRSQSNITPPVGWTQLLEDEGTLLKKGGVILAYVEEDEDVDEGCFSLSKPNLPFEDVVAAMVKYYNAVPIGSAEANDEGFLSYSFDSNEIGYQLIKIDFKSNDASSPASALAFGVMQKNDD